MVALASRECSETRKEPTVCRGLDLGLTFLGRSSPSGLNPGPWCFPTGSLLVPAGLELVSLYLIPPCVGF